jgi:DNA-binding NarL/FixJ family response regulator
VSARRRLTVLVVDDDPRVRAAMVRMLDEMAGVRAAALDSETALRLSTVTGIETDVAVVDVSGPGGPGEAVIRRLAPAVAVVAISLDATQRRTAERAGATLFVEKDGDDRALIDAIRSAAAGLWGENVLGDSGSPSQHKEGHRRCPRS